MSAKDVFTILRNQKGQALLIIVLVMVVALTIGLSVASRTITNLRNTQEQANSQKALSSAEAGVEQAIKSNATVGQTLSGNLSTTTSYTTTITQAGSGTTPFLLNAGNIVPKNDAIYVWLNPYATQSAQLWPASWSTKSYNGTLSIYWGSSTDPCANGAIEAIVITKASSAPSPTATRYVYDSCAARQSVNHFSAPTSSVNTISGTTTRYRADIAITNGILGRVNPYYSDVNIALSGSSPLPSQGTVITSVGTAQNSTQRQVRVYQGFPEIPPEFFPFILFSP